MLTPFYTIASPVSEAVKPRTPGKVYLHFLSELGELAEEINIAAGELYKTAGPDGIIGEAADCLNCMCDMIWINKGSLPADFLDKVDALIPLNTPITTFQEARQTYIDITSRLDSLGALTQGRVTNETAWCFAKLTHTLLSLVDIADPHHDIQFLAIYQAKCDKWLSKAA